ncbi:MAG: SOS response-associated peptidase [Bacteroidales bacterium]
MCFTVNVNLVKEELEERYDARLIDPDKYRPSYYYHAFSIPELPVISSGSREWIELMNWGLIPSWIRDRENADEIRFKTFNARAETIDVKPSFAGSFFSKRCIVPVRGFFEWQHAGGRKIPWYIYRADGDIMSLAGLWSEWNDNDTGNIIKTFTVITTDANEMMARIHNTKKRMPVVLEKKSEEVWLDTGLKKDRVFRLLSPCADEILKAHTISSLIVRKDADKNTPDLIKPFNYNIPETLI